MKSNAEAFRQLESDAKMFESIRQTYPSTSPEFRASRRAAMALTYVAMHARTEFATFVEEMDRDVC